MLIATGLDPLAKPDVDQHLAAAGEGPAAALHDVDVLAGRYRARARLRGRRGNGWGRARCGGPADAADDSAGFYLHVLAPLAEFEREPISERTKPAMASTRRNGKSSRPKLSAAHIAHACDMIRSGKETRWRCRAARCRCGERCET